MRSRPASRTRTSTSAAIEDEAHVPQPHRARGRDRSSRCALAAVRERRATAGRPRQAAGRRQITQPGNNAPVWRDVRSGEPAYTSIKGRETDVLIQPTLQLRSRVTGGETWRLFRNGVITPIGGWLLAAVVVVIGAFYAWKGPVKVHEKPTGRLIKRFTAAAAIRALDDGDQLRHPRRHRHRHAARQVRAAAGDRLHAVRVAHQPVEEPAQLRRADLLHQPAVLHRPVRQGQPAEGVRLQVVRERRRDVRRQARALGPLQRRREGLVLGRRRRAVASSCASPGSSWTSRTSTRCAR